MDRGLFVASSSAANLMDRMAIVAQNMANVSTVGFKKVFDQVASVPLEGGARLPNIREFGVTLTPGVDARPGAVQATGNKLNVAFSPNVYVGLSSGSFTRRGDFMTDQDGVLRLPSGDSVVSSDGAEIAIPVGYEGAIADDGTVWAQDPLNAANRQEIARLGLFSSDSITLRADGLYTLGNPQQLGEGAKGLSSGYVEQSNVSAIDALAAMIETSRLYEMNTKLISAFNSMDQKGSELLSGWQ